MKPTHKSEPEIGKVLVVEDTPYFQNDIARVFGEAGIKVEFAASETLAKRLLESGTFTVVVSDKDLSAGGGSPQGGFLLLKWMQSQSICIPVILTSSFLNADCINDAYRAGFTRTVKRTGADYLDQLVQAVMEALHQSPAAIDNSDEPEVYVSYAWGDDTTPEGIRREDVVNRMCDAVARTGRSVGRDKTVMKPGDSIDAFADKIAKAPRIVAVMSAKSLHSKFCMVDEIYSAYQRSGFRRAEFQSKVIALVMDDATALLEDDISLVKHWNAVYEKDRSDLETVDRERKSLERWAKVHRLGEMCERLLDMLDAIKDIIMPRGYENIVKGNFDEVIGRLPPKRT